jgi:adenylate cyclase
METPAKTAFRLGEIEIDPAQACIRRNGSERYVRPRTFEVLIFLLQQRHRVVTKEELIEKIWDGTAISDDGLVQCVVEIRKALSDDPHEPRFVRTFPKQGYRFIGSVVEIKPSQTRAEKSRARAVLATGLLLILAAGLWLGGSAVRIRRLHPIPPAIAILPFLNLDPRPESQHLSDGLAEDLTTALAQLQGLRVVARTSASQFAGKAQDVQKIGERLNVSAVMEGSIRKSGNQFRVTAQLISTRDGYHLWSKAYEGSASDLFAIQDDIVRQAARSLNIPVPASAEQSWARRRTESPEAHDLYLQGRYLWSQRDSASMQRSVQFFEDAIRKDPGYALAYVGAADAYGVMAANSQMAPAQAVPLAEAAVTRALELDPRLAEAHASLGLVKSRCEWDWRSGEQEFRRAIELNPSYATAHHWAGATLMVLGRFEEADAELRKAQLLDPLSLMITEGLAENFYYWRRYDEAIEQVKRIQQIEQRPGMGSSLLVAAFAQKGMYREAIATAQEYAANIPAAVDLLLARVEAASGDRPKARHLVYEMERTARQGYFPPFHLALAYASLGDKEAAFKWLNEAYQHHDTSMAYIKVEPVFDNLRSDARFPELLKKVGLD